MLIGSQWIDGIRNRQLPSVKLLTAAESGKCSAEWPHG